MLRDGLGNLSLTAALAILAAVVLALLGAHAWWRARKLRPRPKTLEEAVTSRFEPSMQGAGHSQGLVAPLTFDDTQPSGNVPLDALGDSADPPAATAPLLRPAARHLPRLDALIDALVPLRLDAPVTGEMVLAHQPPSRRAGAKPFYIEGLDAETGEWEVPSAGHRFSELQAGVQLVNRGGPLNEIEYSEFVQKVQAYAEAVGAAPDFPDMLEVVARARELDGLISPLDAQLNVTLRCNGATWSLAFLQQVATRVGFTSGAVPSRMLMLSSDSTAPPLLALSIDSQVAGADEELGQGVRECVLTLDVPQIDESHDPYPLFYRVVNELAAGLGATAVDNDGMPLSLHAFTAIGRELEGLYEKLRALDLAAGSPAARRLFS